MILDLPLEIIEKIIISNNYVLSNYNTILNLLKTLINTDLPIHRKRKRNTNNTNKNSTRVQYFTDIVGTLEIEALDQNDNVVKTITLYDAYPKQIIPTQFSNDTPNQYLTLIVDMMYRYYTIT